MGSIPNYYTIIERLFGELQLILNSYISHGYAAVGAYLKAPLGVAIVLYIVLMGWSITQGWVKCSTSNFVKSAVKIGLIYMFAMNWGWFSQYFVGLINNGSGQISDALINATPVPMPHFAGEGINGAMQSALIEFTKIGYWCWKLGSWHNYRPYINAIMIFGFGYALILVAVFELVLAKLMLAVLFALAPLFVGFTLFKPTHSFFDRWLGACVGFGLLTIFVSSILALALSIAQWAIGGTYASQQVDISIVGFIPVMVVGFIGVGMIMKVAQLAQSIGGTVATSSASSLLAGAVGGAVGGAMSSIKNAGGIAGIGKKAVGLASGVAGKVGSSSMNAIRKTLTAPGLRKK